MQTFSQYDIMSQIDCISGFLCNKCEWKYQCQIVQHNLRDKSGGDAESKMKREIHRKSLSMCSFCSVALINVQ